MKYTFRIGSKGVKSKGEETRQKREREKIVRFIEINNIEEKPRMFGDGYHLGGFLV